MDKTDKQIQELENKIAHLCNSFVEGTHAHINAINVYHGPCEKGWFPDEAINIGIEIYWTATFPNTDVEALAHILKVDHEGI